MSYIKQIINYFFHHNASGELKERVYHRLLSPYEDREREEALYQLWNELGIEEEKDRNEWKEAFHRIQLSLDPQKHSYTKHYIFPYRRMRIVAVWLIPFIMLCTSGFFYFSNKRQLQVEEFTSVSYLQHYAAFGTREKVQLSDGSEVWLNAGSTLIYPSVFTSKEREVHLIGEAFFDVQKDSIRPFIVNTHYLKMQVLGTSFNISAYPDESQVEATLETGVLKVNVLNDSTSYYLFPDNQLVYTPSTHIIEQRNVRASDYSEWRMGGLFFNNVPFEDVLHILERTYGLQVHIRNSVYKNQKVYVHFNKDESLETIFQILKLMIPELEYKITGNSVYIE